MVDYILFVDENGKDMLEMSPLGGADFGIHIMSNAVQVAPNYYGIFIDADKIVDPQILRTKNIQNYKIEQVHLDALPHDPKIHDYVPFIKQKYNEMMANNPQEGSNYFTDINDYYDTEDKKEIDRLFSRDNIGEQKMKFDNVYKKIMKEGSEDYMLGTVDPRETEFTRKGLDIERTKKFDNQQKYSDLLHSISNILKNNSKETAFKLVRQLPHSDLETQFVEDVIKLIEGN